MLIKIFRQLFLSIILFTFISLVYAEESKPVKLQVIEKNITVNGKKSRVFAIVQPDGTFGYVGKKGDWFDVTVENKTKVPLVLHWHGIVLPNDQDGVPYVTQLPIPPGSSYHYKYKLVQSGTHWLHSHYKLQEQKLMAAPLIIHDPDEEPEKEAVMFIQDFSFKNPKTIYSELRKKLQQNPSPKNQIDMNMDMDGMNMEMDDDQHMSMKNMKGMKKKKSKNEKMASMKMDVTDVKFDAYLTNHRTLRNPDIIRVVPNQTLRLRVINASASSNYYIDLGKLKGTLIAVDGDNVKPIEGSRFQIGIGNRLDIRVRIPEGKSAYPILALPEGTRQQTGLILATKGAASPPLSEYTQKENPILNYDQEFKLSPLNPMPSKPITRSLVYNLEGDMSSYRWTINGQAWPKITPFKIKSGERIELIFNNKSGMAHPMHFHGHNLQVSEINGKPVEGRQGDTFNIMPNSSLKVFFDADNPGIWMVHCHILYHQMGGMMTTLDYAGYPNKFTLKQREEGEKLYNVAP